MPAFWRRITHKILAPQADGGVCDVVLRFLMRTPYMNRKTKIKKIEATFFRARHEGAYSRITTSQAGRAHPSNLLILLFIQ